VDNEAEGGSGVAGVGDAFDIIRFRECELQHSRWAMLGFTGSIVAEALTGRVAGRERGGIVQVAAPLPLPRLHLYSAMPARGRGRGHRRLAGTAPPPPAPPAL